MQKVSTFFLKIAVVIIGIPILALCIFFVPALSRESAELLPQIPFIELYIFIILYGSAIPFYFALYQAFILLRLIDHRQAFSDFSVQSLKKIKYCGMIICILHLLMLPLFYVFAEVDDAPGLIFVGCFVPFASFVIALFAAVLQRLLQEAIDIKKENELII